MISDAGAEAYWFCSLVGFKFHYLTISELEEREIILAILAAEEVDDSVIPASYLDRVSGEEIQSHEADGLEPKVIFEKDGEYQGLSEAQSPISSIPLIEFKTSQLLGINETWIFTESDPDPIPSIPHGHYKDKDKPEPKLNPYTGKAININGSEDKKRRLTKKEMVILWDSSVFQEFCIKKLRHFVNNEPTWQRYISEEYLIFPKPWKWNKELRNFWQKQRYRKHH